MRLEEPLMFCPECSSELLKGARYCDNCGVKLPETAADRPADAVVQDSVIVGDEVVFGGKHIHQVADPTARRQATMTGMICPVCHQVVVGAEWFQCPKCERRYIHNMHQDSATYLCSECAAAAHSLTAGVKVGELIGERYELRKLLGRGGMGEVFLGFDRELGRQFALKFLPPEIAHSPAAMADLRHEAELLLELAHENLVRLYDLVTVGPHRFLKLEFVDGPTLEEVLGRQAEAGERCPVETVLALAQQICSGLAYLHQHRVVHRDLKPANLMLTSANVLKVMDFGIARSMRDTMSRVSNAPTTGTLVYMSPEQLQGGPLDHRSDIYSLGCVLYELVSGKPPFHSGAIYEQHLNAHPSALENVPLHVAAAIQRALAKKPEARFQSCDQLLEALTTESPDQPPAPERQKDFSILVERNGQWSAAVLLGKKDEKYLIHYVGAKSGQDELVPVSRIRLVPEEKNVEVEWEGKWYPAEILRKQGKRYLVHYVGWSSEWDEWVPKKRIRWSRAKKDKQGCTRQSKIEVEWDGTWYPAKILKREGNRYFVHYAGYDSSWDEWVTEERMRALE